MAEQYEIVQQRQTVNVGPAGGFEDVWEVTFRVLPGGTVGKVYIPTRAYNASTVRAAIDVQVANILDVESL